LRQWLCWFDGGFLALDWGGFWLNFVAIVCILLLVSLFLVGLDHFQHSRQVLNAFRVCLGQLRIKIFPVLSLDLLHLLIDFLDVSLTELSFVPDLKVVVQGFV
jgi:hypothetical protein